MKEDNDLMLGILIHEILHNFEAKLGFVKINNKKDSLNRENKINQLTVEVLKDLNIQFDSFVNFIELLKKQI